MLCSNNLLNIQVVQPLLGTGLQAARRLKTSFTSYNENNSASSCTSANTATTEKIPFLPSYVDRMMPFSSILTSGFYVPAYLAPKNSTTYNKVFFSSYPFLKQQSRSFMMKSSQTSGTKKNTLSDNDKLNSAISRIQKECDLPVKSSAILRLGIHEGLQMAKEESKTKPKFSVGPSLQLLLTVSLLAWIGYQLFISVIGKPKTFRSTDDKGVHTGITFADVCGVNEVKEELEDIVEYLQDPERFQQVGAKLPSGVLLCGPPGTGKTLLAKAVAGEAGVPFFYCSGSEFDEMFVGVGAMRVRELFQSARAQSPAIIFIDEIDAVGSTRTNSTVAPYARQTINQLLQEMDGFVKGSEPVVVLAATNTEKVLDSALTRPGRFDMQVQVMLPDIKGRKEMLQMYINKLGSVPSDNINLDRLASLTIGMSGADISNIVNQAALAAAKRHKTGVSQEDLEYALDKCKMGPESKSRSRTEQEIRETAQHEAGHALVAYYSPAAHNIYKATIRQRGQALGHVSFLPSAEDESSSTKEKLVASIDVAMGGRVAEELMLGTDRVTTGASSDIDMATKSAYQLICQYGMSEKLGPMNYDIRYVSEETKRAVEVEVRRYLESSYKKAKSLLTSRSFEHNLLSEALIRYETLTMDEIKLTLDSRDLEAVAIAREKEARINLRKQAAKAAGNGHGFDGISVPVIDYVPPPSSPDPSS